MVRNMLVVGWLVCVAPLHATVRHSSDLGWTAGQDISGPFASLLSDGTIKPGDELRLDDTYRISGTHRLPDDFTLAAVKGGGFDVTDAVSDRNRTFLILGNRTTLRNLTITYLDTPPLGPDAGTNPTRGVHFYPMIGITASGKSDIRIEHCRLEGSINHQIKLSDCARPQVIGCHILGGYWSTYLTGNVTDPVFRNCLIEQCQGDGIKTGRGGPYGVKRALVENCVFQDCGRDAIDTTGGWKDSIVRNCILRRLFSGMDIKSYFRRPEHLSPHCRNSDILIERCTFTDMANCITFSTLDRGIAEGRDYFLDPVTAQEYAPHDVDINDCTFERTGSSPVRMLLLKGGHSIRYRNAQFRGEGIETVKYTNVYEVFGPKSLSKEVSEALNHSFSGTLGPTAPARAPGDTSTPFPCGPRQWAPAASVSPGPDVFRIGNAVAPINSWMTAWTLNDIFKTAGFENELGDTRPSRMWVPVFGGQWQMEKRFDVPTDALGWPTSLTLRDGRRPDKLVTVVHDTDAAGSLPAGRYRVTYQGTGTLQFDGAEVVDEPAPGRMHIRYDGTKPLFLAITETDPQSDRDYLRDIRLLRPDAKPGARFHAAYLDYLRPFAVIRPLHMMGEDLTYGAVAAWSQRKPENYSHWGGAWGAPFEVIVDLANQSYSDLWLTIPIAANDHYVRQLARLVLHRLDSHRRVYLELGNEIWNYAFPYAKGRAYMLEKAKARWPGVLGKVRPYSDGDPVHETMMIYSWQGLRTVEISALFEEVWGSGSDRIVTVLAGQIGAAMPNWAPSRYLMESPVYVGEEQGRPAGRCVDAFAIGPYVHEPVEGAFSRESPAAYLADAIAYVKGTGRWTADAEEPGLRYQIRHDRALAREFGLSLVAYEGGQHFAGSRFTRDEVNTHRAMYDLYRALFDVWQGEGGGLFVHFAGIIPRGRNEPGKEPTYFQSENFGIKEYQTQPLDEAHKYRAVLDVMKQIGQSK